MWQLATIWIDSLDAVDDLLAGGDVGRGLLVADVDDAGDALPEVDGHALLLDNGFKVAWVRITIFTGRTFFSTNL